MAVIRLARSPIAALLRWWDLRAVNARIRWAEGDLKWERGYDEPDQQKVEYLKGHIEQLRVERALLEK